jgi:hypothetical protein
MKKLVFASVMALATISLVTAPMLRAQDSTITIKDPAEFNTYQMAISQSDPAAKAAAFESFLTAYPQSVVKADVLDRLIDTYSGMQNPDKTLTATTRLLQIDPANMKAIFMSVLIKKGQCGKTVNPKTGVSSDPQTCDDAAALAQKGLTAAKPAAITADDWKKQTGGAYPIFHSAIALDDTASKKDYAGAVAEYTSELMLYSDDQAKTAGLQDTLLLAQTYAQPSVNDQVKAIWFFARVWNFVPANYKASIEKSLEFYYRKFHGNLDGLDAVKSQAALTTFPPGTLVITPDKTPAEKIHDIILTTPDLKTLNLGDKETVLAVGAKEDADKMWAVLKDQVTPVPGTVISATDSVIKVAVSSDAKSATPPYADFIVNMKKPLEEKEIPSVGFEYKIPPASALVGTYDSFTVIPATDTTPAAAQIVLRDGEVQLEKKKPVPVHKPAAGHPASH